MKKQFNIPLVITRQQRQLVVLMLPVTISKTIERNRCLANGMIWTHNFQLSSLIPKPLDRGSSQTQSHFLGNFQSIHFIQRLLWLLCANFWKFWVSIYSIVWAHRPLPCVWRQNVYEMFWAKTNSRFEISHSRPVLIIYFCLFKTVDRMCI